MTNPDALTLVERYDAAGVAWVLANREAIVAEVPEHEKFLDAAKLSLGRLQRPVLYERRNYGSGIGRFYASGCKWWVPEGGGEKKLVGPAMQGWPRKLTNALVPPERYDLDAVASCPSLLLDLCQQVLHLDVPELADYIANREASLGTEGPWALFEAAGKSRDWYKGRITALTFGSSDTRGLNARGCALQKCLEKAMAAIETKWPDLRAHVRKCKRAQGKLYQCGPGTTTSLLLHSLESEAMLAVKAFGEATYSWTFECFKYDGFHVAAGVRPTAEQLAALTASLGSRPLHVGTELMELTNGDLANFRPTTTFKIKAFDEVYKGFSRDAAEAALAGLPRRQQNRAATATAMAVEAPEEPDARVDTGAVVAAYDEQNALATKLERVTVNERYLSALPALNIGFSGATLLVKSPMGTGKTQALVKALEGLPRSARILVITPRYSLARSMPARLAALGDFVLYKTLPGDLGPVQRLVVQFESLWRIRGAQHYDVVVLDESESILAQATSVQTNAANHVRNIQAFTSVLGTAGRVYAMDAMLSDRTMEALAALCPGYSRSLLVNTFEPQQRRAVTYAYLANWLYELRAAITAGQRVHLVFSSVRKLLAFKLNFLDVHFKDRPDAVWIHHGRDKSKDVDLEDVNAAWSTKQVVVHTTSISQGVSYDPSDPALRFDVQFLYGSAGGPPARELMQAVLRVRHLQAPTGDHCHVFLYESPFGRKAEDVSLAGIKARLEADQAVYRSWATRNDIDIPAQSPAWLQALFVRRVAESCLSNNHFPAVMRLMLHDHGYVLNPAREKRREDLSLSYELPAWDSIGTLTSDEAEARKAERNAGAPFDEDTILALDKYYFLQHFKTEELAAEHWSDYSPLGKDRSNYAALQAIRAERLQLPDSELARSDTEGRVMEGLSSSLMRRQQLRNLLVALNVAGASEIGILAVGNTNEMTISPEAITAAQTRVQGSLPEIRRVFGKRGNTTTEGGFRKLIEAVGEAFGINVAKVARRSGPSGQRGPRVYSLVLRPNTLWTALRGPEDPSPSFAVQAPVEAPMPPLPLEPVAEQQQHGLVYYFDEPVVAHCGLESGPPEIKLEAAAEPLDEPIDKPIVPDGPLPSPVSDDVVNIGPPLDSYMFQTDRPNVVALRCGPEIAPSGFITVRLPY